MDADRLDDDVTGCAAAHQSLLADLDQLTDEQARADSLLPKWTVGHVLNHIFRNAESMIRVFAAAAEGMVVERYAGGDPGRDAGIEDGAARPAAELVGDVRSTIWRLEQSWATASAAAWQGRSLEPSAKEIPVTDLPFMRWREVEIHHADLGLGFSLEDWSDEYVASELAEQLPKLPMRLEDTVADGVITGLRDELGDHRFLAWIVGRWSRPGLPAIRPWQ